VIAQADISIFFIVAPSPSPWPFPASGRGKKSTINFLFFSFLSLFLYPHSAKSEIEFAVFFHLQSLCSLSLPSRLRVASDRGKQFTINVLFFSFPTLFLYPRSTKSEIEFAVFFHLESLSLPSPF
jgi:hypothetical protein